MKVCVCGSRGIFCPALVALICDCYLTDCTVLLSGGAQGVDSFAEKWAAHKGVDIERHPALWNQFHRRAGIVRNEVMVRKSDFVLAIWDGISRGTLSTIGFAKQYGVPVQVVRL